MFVLSCDFVTFPDGVQGHMWYSIVSFPDLCLPLYLYNQLLQYGKQLSACAPTTAYVARRRPTSTYIYQSPLILTEWLLHNLINVSYLTACYLYQVMMTLHFLGDVANDAESTQK